MKWNAFPRMPSYTFSATYLIIFAKSKSPNRMCFHFSSFCFRFPAAACMWLNGVCVCLLHLVQYGGACTIVAYRCIFNGSNNEGLNWKFGILDASLTHNRTRTFALHRCCRSMRIATESYYTKCSSQYTDVLRRLRTHTTFSFIGSIQTERRWKMNERNKAKRKQQKK